MVRRATEPPKMLNLVAALVHGKRYKFSRSKFYSGSENIWWIEAASVHGARLSFAFDTN